MGFACRNIPAPSEHDSSVLGTDGDRGALIDKLAFADLDRRPPRPAAVGGAGKHDLALATATGAAQENTVYDIDIVAGHILGGGAGGIDGACLPRIPCAFGR